MQRSGTSFKSVFLSILLHLGAAALLIVSIDMNTRTLRQSHPEVVQAVIVDSKEVEKELQKLQEIDKQKQKKQEEAEQKLKEAEQQLAAAKQQRKQEEIKVTEAKKKQELEQKKREEEQNKLADIKKQQEEVKKKQLTEEAERKREEQDAAKQKQLAEKQKADAAAQAQLDQQFKNNFSAEIGRRVSNNFNISGLPPGLKCVISVRLIPGGEILNVSIKQSSGNEIFDNRALVAVQKTSPLPVPLDTATFERLGLRQFSFTFIP
ncbi:MAG: cell envelope biosis protein TonB [Gammaproteobacteria bacterium]|nr:cell envelope biosis protein TonB [Gammaproteobacteria bacterium]